MRILHIPFSYYPDPAGGTEVYVNALAQWQRSLGCEAAVAAPATLDSQYEIDGTPVWRFAVSPSPSLREMYGEGDRTAAVNFRSILDRYAPDILHVHAFTGAVSILLAEEAARRGITVVFNYHTPTVSCARGTLLRWGSEICDGDLGQRPCAACMLASFGMARPLASLISHTPAAVSRQIGAMGLSGGIWTGLQMPELVDVRIAGFRRLMQISSRVFALCNWTRDLLIRNGVPAAKVTLCRQGISWQSVQRDGDRLPRLPLRVAFLGRFDVTKGTHIIVQAMKDNPDLPVELDLFGVRQGESGNQYAGQVQKLIAGDARIRVLPAMAPGDVVPGLREYDLLAVPSQWLETGPLVVLEAFAAGTPVLGSDLGGIAELVRDGVDGLLVKPAHSPAAWAESLRRLCLDLNLISSLRAGIRTPRHTRDVALEMMPVYQEALGRDRIPVCQ